MEGHRSPHASTLRAADQWDSVKVLEYPRVREHRTRDKELNLVVKRDSMSMMSCDYYSKL